MRSSARDPAWGPVSSTADAVSGRRTGSTARALRSCEMSRQRTGAPRTRAWLRLERRSGRHTRVERRRRFCALAALWPAAASWRITAARPRGRSRPHPRADAGDEPATAHPRRDRRRGLRRPRGAVGAAQAGPRRQRRRSLALLRPAHGLPARRRGVARAGRVRRLIGPVQRRLAALGGAEPADRRRDGAPAERASPASPVAAGDGSRRAMDFAINTGDVADSQQLNETEWVRTLMEGGPLDPNSGVDPAGYTHPPARRRAPPIADARRRRLHRRAGLRRLRRGPDPQFYDPDDARRRVRRLARATRA